MCIAADMEKVYEIGPGESTIMCTGTHSHTLTCRHFTLVFRAENSYTHRHMTEFIGLDLEMTFNEHYHEVMETIDEMLKSIFQGLKDQYAPQIETIKKQFPHEEFVFLPKTLVLSYAECIKILQDNKVEQLTDGEEGAPQTMQIIGDEDDMRLVCSLGFGLIIG